MHRFDIEATRTAVNILRNLSLPQSARAVVVAADAVPPLLAVAAKSPASDRLRARVRLRRPRAAARERLIRAATVAVR